MSELTSPGAERIARIVVTPSLWSQESDHENREDCGIRIVLVLLYAATSMAHLRAASMDVCNESSDCTVGYACDKSGDTCEPNLTGKYIKIGD